MNGTPGLLLTMGGTTLAKCLPSLEKPAPIQTETISSLSAMIMSTNGRTVKNTRAGRYCSPRAARKIDLVAQPVEHQQDDHRDEQHRVDQPGGVAGHRGGQRVAVRARQHKRDDDAGEERR